MRRAAQPLGSSLFQSAAGVAGGEENAVLLAQAAVDPSWEKGAQGKTAFSSFGGARFSIVIMIASPWINEGMAGTPQLASHSVTHPSFPDILKTPESV